MTRFLISDLSLAHSRCKYCIWGSYKEFCWFNALYNKTNKIWSSITSLSKEKNSKQIAPSSNITTALQLLEKKRNICILYMKMWVSPFKHLYMLNYHQHICKHGVQWDFPFFCDFSLNTNFYPKNNHFPRGWFW